MRIPALPTDSTARTTFKVGRASDTAELDAPSRVSDRLPGSSREDRDRLHDRALSRMRFGSRVFSVAICSAGPILASHDESRLATDVSVSSDESDVFGFSMPLRGHMTLVQRGNPTTAALSGRLAHRLGTDTRLASTDRCAISRRPSYLSHGSR
ncbi:hypothetical protein [Falsiroseomonas oryzae]|uniref:hypothetical protein n=1 Tax=Falsiroseomonas oryzae TaxID=2766473 RepID=UPI0022EA5D86|nr:hypothetical protein [Roseomonas sp. MO-31]